MELDMTKGSPLKLIIKFIIPVIIGNIFQQFYNLADTMIVGRCLGVEALAAVGATGSVMFMILGFVQGLTAGFTVLTAQSFGAGNRKEMKKSISGAVFLSIIVTVVVTIVAVWGIGPLLKVMKTPSDVYDMALAYMIVICAGICTNVIYNLQASFLRAIGNSVVPLAMLIISSVVNIILDYMLIVYGNMGVAGAAYATVISQGISGILCFIYIIKCVPTLHMKKEEWKIYGNCIKRQLKIGVPMALQFSITAIGGILVQSALNMFGAVVIASYSVTRKVEMLFTTAFEGMGVTMATYCAQNMGKNDISRVRKGVRTANIISGVYAVIIFIILYQILPFTLKLFVEGDISEILGYAKTYLIITGIFFIALGMIFIFRNAMQGCGYSFAPMMGGVVELISRCILAVIATKFMSFEGVCMVNSCAWLTAGVFLMISYFRMIKKQSLTDKNV